MHLKSIYWTCCHPTCRQKFSSLRITLLFFRNLRPRSRELMSPAHLVVSQTKEQASKNFCVYTCVIAQAKLHVGSSSSTSSGTSLTPWWLLLRAWLLRTWLLRSRLLSPWLLLWLWGIHYICCCLLSHGFKHLRIALLHLLSHLHDIRPRGSKEWPIISHASQWLVSYPDPFFWMGSWYETSQSLQYEKKLAKQGKSNTFLLSVSRYTTSLSSSSSHHFSHISTWNTTTSHHACRPTQVWVVCVYMCVREKFKNQFDCILNVAFRQCIYVNIIHSIDHWLTFAEMQGLTLLK